MHTFNVGDRVIPKDRLSGSLELYITKIHITDVGGNCTDKVELSDGTTMSASRLQHAFQIGYGAYVKEYPERIGKIVGVRGSLVELQNGRRDISVVATKFLKSIPFRIGDTIKMRDNAPYSITKSGTMWTVLGYAYDHGPCVVVEDGHKISPLYFDLIQEAKIETKETKKVIASKTDWLFQNLDPEYRALHTLYSKKKPSSSKILDMLQKEIRTIRHVAKNPTDELYLKLRRHGNSGDWGSQKLYELSRAVFQDKMPAHGSDTYGKWISVEIECIFPDKHSVDKFVSFVRQNDLKDCVTVKDDGSLRVGMCPECGVDDMEDDDGCNCGFGPLAKEVVVSFLHNDWNAINKVCGKLNELGCYVNKSCGLHVHFDCRDTTKATVRTRGDRIARCLPALKALLPKSRQNNKYCATDINTFSSSSGENRYAFINMAAYNRHETIEIRGHSGTTQALKIINWIKILNTIMYSRKREVIYTPEELITSFNFESDMAEYIRERATKFKKDVIDSTFDDVQEDDVIDSTFDGVQEDNEVQLESEIA